MNKILSLCINLLLFIISEAVPIKLITGDRSVVKKDGATHTISKYYVVPNDFNPNNVTNGTEISQTTLRMNHILYSKSKDADTARQHQVSEKRTEAANNQNNENNASVDNNEVDRHSDFSRVIVVLADDDTAESAGSVNTEQNLGPDGLGNLQVEPIANFTNVNINITTNEGNVYNSSEAFQKDTLLTVENTTQSFKKDVEDKLEDLFLTKFIAVQKITIQNIESFWKLLKLNIDRISDDDELLLIKIEKMSMLLNIFTNLYEAAQSQKPVESMIDSIIDILQTTFVEVKKSNTNESQSQTDVTGDYDEECLRKCGQKRSKPQLDPNGTYLSETESQEASDNLELKNLDLQSQQGGDSDDGIQVDVINQPSNILRSQLLVPNNLNVGVPDGFNVRSVTTTGNLNHIPPDSADIDERLDDQLLTMKTRLTDNIMPWTIEDKSTKNLDDQTLTIESNLDDNTILIDDKTTDNLPWHIEDKTTNHQPWIIEHRTTNTLPWSIVDRGTKKLPWKVKNRAEPNWTIENIMGHSPKTLYPSRYPSVITHGDKIFSHPNQPMTGTVHSVKHGVKKPYHIYTYVINPETSLYDIPTSGNIVKVKSKQPNANLETRLYGLSTSHGGNKIVYANQPSPSYYESHFSFSKPSVDITTYGTSSEVNPSDLFSETTQDDNQPKYLVGPETNHKAALLQPNTLLPYSQTNSDQENEVQQVPEVGSHSGVLLLNVPSTGFESLINLGNTEPVFPASADTSDVNPDIGNTEPNPYNPNINLNRIQQTNYEYTNLTYDYDVSSPVYGTETHKHTGLISPASSNSEYTIVVDDYDKPSPVYGRETHKHPGMIFKASSSSEYINLPDDYDKTSPVYGTETHKHTGLISPASSNSEYTIVVDDYDKPSPVYGGQTHKYPGVISKASADSEYTNLPNDYINPMSDYGQHTNRHPGLITKVSHYPEYANVVHGYDEPIPLYGGQIQKHPGFISKASSHSEYTNLPNEYNNPTSDYEEDTDRYSVHIQTPVNGRPTKIEDNLLVNYHPYGYKVHAVQPSLIAHHGNQPTGLNYFKHLKVKLAPTYRLFTLDNLLKLHDAVIKAIKANGDKSDVYDNQELMNLRKIINIILILAEHLQESEGSIDWYEKIFYNTQRENRHPLESYVYNLIRQRWLHELILVLYNNNFNFNILQNPRIFSFLGSWQFPNYILNFMEIEELLKHKFDAPEIFDQTVSSHGLQDKLDTHTSENLETYVTNNVIESYKKPNTGIVLSIAGVEAEPDANAIILILQKYLHYKSFIEQQEKSIIRENMVEMLKQIILFLREKRYDASTIADLIRKLYTVVYRTEGTGCQTHHINFAKNMYDVILPVLRRSGRIFENYYDDYLLNTRMINTSIKKISMSA